MKPPVDTKKILKEYKEIHTPENYEDSPLRQGIIHSSFPEHKVVQIQTDRDTARVQLREALNTIDNQRTELRKLNDKVNSWGRFEKIGYNIDILISMFIEGVRSVLNKLRKNKDADKATKTKENNC